MMRKERTGQSNRKYANIIIAYGSKLIHLEYRSKKKTQLYKLHNLICEYKVAQSYKFNYWNKDTYRETICGEK